MIYISLAEADILPAQCRDPVEDGGHNADRQTDFDEDSLGSVTLLIKALRENA